MEKHEKHARHNLLENDLPGFVLEVFGAKRLTGKNWKTNVSTGVGDHFKSPQDAERYLNLFAEIAATQNKIAATRKT